jgi:hypothetical protein
MVALPWATAAASDAAAHASSSSSQSWPPTPPLLRGLPLFANAAEGWRSGRAPGARGAWGPTSARRRHTGPERAAARCKNAAACRNMEESTHILKKEEASEEQMRVKAYNNNLYLGEDF